MPIEGTAHTDAGARLVALVPAEPGGLGVSSAHDFVGASSRPTRPVTTSRRRFAGAADGRRSAPAPPTSRPSASNPSCARRLRSE
jgi:hypothetical protein